MREHLESTSHLVTAGSITLGALLQSSPLAGADRLHTTPRLEREVTDVARARAGRAVAPGELVLHGPGPLDWGLITISAREGASGVVIPRTWPGRTSPMVTALAESQRIPIFAVDPATDWDELGEQLGAAQRRLAALAAAPALVGPLPLGASELRKLLDGAPVTRYGAELVEPGCCVLAFAAVQSSFIPGEADDALDRALWLAMLDPDVPGDAEGTRIGTTAFVVFRRSRPEHELRPIAEHLRRLLSVTLDRAVLAAIGSPIATAADLAASRTDASRVLALARRRTNPGTATLGDVQHLALLEEAAAVLNAQPHLMSQKLALLRRSDATRNTSYVTVLRAFLDNFGDVNTSAERLGMHHNTFRYRLKRAVEVAGMNLDDPAERLALQVELAVGG